MADALCLWTGRVVEVEFVRASPGTTPCKPERHCGHWTRTINFQCCGCGAEFLPADPVERAEFQRKLDDHLAAHPRPTDGSM